MSDQFHRALAAIDAAHSQDPNITTTNPITTTNEAEKSLEPTAKSLPYELHYAQKMTSYLESHSPDASELLRLAIRAQHLRRWEVARSSYPATKAGYLNWRTFLKNRQADQAKQICLEAGYSSEEAERVASLIRKEGLKRKSPAATTTTTTGAAATNDGSVTEKSAGVNSSSIEKSGENETQVLEDVACLVFLDDQFAAFEKEHDEEKILGILRKTWAKMSDRGHRMALEIQMSDRCRELVQKAVGS